jgi:hypothetical protein
MTWRKDQINSIAASRLSSSALFIGLLLAVSCTNDALAAAVATAGSHFPDRSKPLLAKFGLPANICYSVLIEMLERVAKNAMKRSRPAAGVGTVVGSVMDTPIQLAPLLAAPYFLETLAVKAAASIVVQEEIARLLGILLSDSRHHPAPHQS